MVSDLQFLSLNQSLIHPLTCRKIRRKTSPHTSSILDLAKFLRTRGVSLVFPTWCSIYDQFRKRKWNPFEATFRLLCDLQLLCRKLTKIISGRGRKSSKNRGGRAGMNTTQTRGRSRCCPAPREISSGKARHVSGTSRAQVVSLARATTKSNQGKTRTNLDNFWDLKAKIVKRRYGQWKGSAKLGLDRRRGSAMAFERLEPIRFSEQIKPLA